MEVIDLYAGCGGFSAGALMAGCRVIAGVDCDPSVLKAWEHNTGAKGTVADLWKDTPAIPPASANTHIHLSPPCTKLSRANLVRCQNAVCDALHDISAAIEFTLDRGFTSWSLENVATRATCSAFDAIALKRRGLVDYVVLDAVDYGCPSNRRRLIAGPPRLIDHLKKLKVPHVSVREAFAARGVQVPALFLKNTARYKGIPTIRSVDGPCHTQVASNPLSWCTCDGVTVRDLYPSEVRVIMGFPDNWSLPVGNRKAVRALGNAVPPPLACSIMHAAMAARLTSPQ